MSNGDEDKSKSIKNENSKENNGHPENNDDGQSKKVFVGNLTDECTQSQLSSLFEEYGKVRECSIIRDYAFVHFTEARMANEAVAALNGKFFNGKPLSVQLSMSRFKKSPGRSLSGMACFTCGAIGHRSSRCPNGSNDDRGEMRRRRSRSPRRPPRDHWEEQAPYGRDAYQRDPYARGGPYPRDPYANDYYARDPYVRDPYARDPYARDPYARDPYARDPYARDPYARDPYAREDYPRRRPMRGNYDRPSAGLYREPIEQYKSYSEPYARPSERDVPKDPYGRPPPDYYARKRL